MDSHTGSGHMHSRVAMRVTDERPRRLRSPTCRRLSEAVATFGKSSARCGFGIGGSLGSRGLRPTPSVSDRVINSAMACYRLCRVECHAPNVIFFPQIGSFQETIMELNGIDVFVAAVEAGGFAAAGERLHLTRSAVAKAIARIEEKLNVRLFQRTTRSLRLTEDGQVYYERCVRALKELRAGEAALESGRREAAGRLRVSAPVLLGRRCVAPVLAKVAAQHSKLELELSLSDRPVDLIEDGFDLAIRGGNNGDGAGLMTRTIGSHRMTVCGAPTYLAKHGRPKRLDDLSRHIGIVYGRAGHMRTWEFPV